jgi:predicted DCC family thiol-disulfide oxidoreductase YuxK
MANEQITKDEQDVVIYDGHCKFCTRAINRLRRLDWLQKFRYVSLHDAEVAEKFPHLTYDMLMAEMYVVDRKGKAYGGVRALRYLSWRVPLMWFIAPILNIPGTLSIWTWLYQLVARNRYRFGKIEECDGGTCHLHFGPKRAEGAQAKN